MFQAIFKFLKTEYARVYTKGVGAEDFSLRRERGYFPEKNDFLAHFFRHKSGYFVLSVEIHRNPPCLKMSRNKGVFLLNPPIPQNFGGRLRRAD